MSANSIARQRLEGRCLHVLIADDDEGDRKQIRRVIHQSMPPSDCIEAATAMEALAACEGTEFDLVIMDYQLPGEDGLAALSAFRQKFPFLPIVMCTGRGDEMIAIEAMKRGAADYIAKARMSPSTLQHTIENALEKTALQRRVRQQQEELENFARVLVHDLRAPACAIETFAGRIGERLHEGNLVDALEYADWVMQRARRMNRLIDTLHQYTKADAEVAFEAVDMNLVFDEARANLQHLIQESGASVTADRLPCACGEAAQLIQLLQNLLGNGIKYCDQTTARVHVAASDRALSGEGENRWTFSVADNGVGIATEDYKRIFEPFIRLKGARRREGTGLGLATCKKIVERHRGAIWCESLPGSGTTFFFTLPDRIRTPGEAPAR